LKAARRDADRSEPTIAEEDMSEPIWSRRFAEDVAKALGFPMSEGDPDGKDEALRREGEQLVADLTEQFRFLPAEQVNWVFDLAHLLRARENDAQGGSRPYGWSVAKLREVRDYQTFLRGRYGSAEPADEKDYWTDEDREDIQREAMRRLDEEDPYPWEEEDAPAG
jgi:hypothetical protein